jgi:ribosomal protein L11 methylase PrmA
LTGLATVKRVAGSYRDRKGHVHAGDDRIFRTVSAEAADAQRGFLASPVYRRRAAAGQWIGTQVLDDPPAGLSDAALVLEHERLDFISHPYEWPFAALREAALLHLDLHLDLLAHGYTLSDASAYNLQFRGPRPVFIDALSVERYVEGAYWQGHRQFCDQFLSPLLYSSRFGLPYNAWYRGAMEGLSSSDLAALLGWRDWLSPRMALNILLPARLEAAARRGKVEAARPTQRRALPKAALRGMLEGLRRWIAGLQPPASHTDWTSYAADNTYNDAERVAKRAFVAEAVARAKPALVLDLGCNTGDYAKAALEAGAKRVIGAEADAATAHLAFLRAQAENLEFLPLVQDAVNPSPAQGWLELERPSFGQRARFDFLVALAVEHHLAIGRNVPLDQLVGWLVGLAPRGVVEFVQKDDTTIRRMLALREDVFPDYTEGNFRALLSANARIVGESRVSDEGRIIFHYERD